LIRRDFRRKIAMLFNDGEICEIRFCTKLSENEEPTGTVLLELTKPRHV
jgi:hypothetical protein